MATDQTQDNLGIVLVGWVDAIRRRDLDALAAHLHPDVFWQGVLPGYTCDGRETVLAHFAGREELPHAGVERVDLVASGDQVVLGVRSRELERVGEVELGGQIFLVFTIRAGKIARLEDHATRRAALDAAGIAAVTDWL